MGPTITLAIVSLAGAGAHRAAPEPLVVQSGTSPAASAPARHASPPPRSGSATIYEEKDVDVRPVRLTGAMPEYPKNTPPLRAGERLSVTYSFVITEQGEVTEFEIVEGAASSNPVGQAVMAAYSRWKFSPALKRGVPVRVRVRRRHTFLGDKSAGHGPSTPPAAGVATRSHAGADERIPDERSVDTRPQKVSGTNPVFPAGVPALMAGQRASVTVVFEVTQSGEVTDVQVVESAGSLLDDAVVAAVKTWKYTPAMYKGAPVRVRLTRRHTFLGE